MSFAAIFVSPTSHCPVVCEHCFYEVGHLQRADDRDFVEPLGEALSDLADRGLQQVIVTGGEPLASARTEAIVKLAVDQLVHVLLLTRGDLLDRAMLARLAELGVDDITIGAPRLTPGLQQTVQTTLFHSRYFPTLLTSLTRKTIMQLDEFIDFSRKRDLAHILTPAYIPAESPQHEALSLHAMDEAEWAVASSLLRRWAERAGTGRYVRVIEDRFRRGIDRRPAACAMGTAALVVDSDGSVYPCFHRRDLCVGNLRHDPWPQIRQTLEAVGPQLRSAPCFGEHCVSLFAGDL